LFEIIRDPATRERKEERKYSQQKHQRTSSDPGNEEYEIERGAVGGSRK